MNSSDSNPASSLVTLSEMPALVKSGRDTSHHSTEEQQRGSNLLSVCFHQVAVVRGSLRGKRWFLDSEQDQMKWLLKKIRNHFERDVNNSILHLLRIGHPSLPVLYYMVKPSVE